MSNNNSTFVLPGFRFTKQLNQPGTKSDGWETFANTKIENSKKPNETFKAIGIGDNGIEFQGSEGTKINFIGSNLSKHEILITITHANGTQIKYNNSKGKCCYEIISLDPQNKNNTCSVIFELERTVSKEEQAKCMVCVKRTNKKNIYSRTLTIIRKASILDFIDSNPNEKTKFNNTSDFIENINKFVISCGALQWPEINGFLLKMEDLLEIYFSKWFEITPSNSNSNRGPSK